MPSKKPLTQGLFGPYMPDIFWPIQAMENAVYNMRKA
jgi:hypothetical protein